MAGDLRIGYLNRVDSPGVVVANTEHTLLPASNLQTPDIRELWRANSTSAALTVDFGQVFTIEVIALLRTNLSGSDTIQVRMSQTDPAALTSLSYDSGILTPGIDTVYRKFVHFAPPGTLARYLRVTLVQVSSCEAGRLIAMRHWAPSRNMSYGWEVTWRDPSRRTMSLGQATFIDEREAQRGLRLKFIGLDPEEGQDEMGEINRQKGTSQDILVCLNHASTELGEDTFWGLLEKPIDYPQPRPLSIDGDLEMWERL